MSEDLYIAGEKIPEVEPGVYALVGDQKDRVKNKLGGFNNAQEALRCLDAPLGCGKPLSETNSFRDEVSAREYRLSGFCQDCQDEVFGE